MEKFTRRFFLKKDDNDQETRKVVKYTSCPYGHDFGYELDAYDDCDNCDAILDCARKCLGIE